jgi:hypothetical protein
VRRGKIARATRRKQVASSRFPPCQIVDTKVSDAIERHGFRRNKGIESSASAEAESRLHDRARVAEIAAARSSETVRDRASAPVISAIVDQPTASGFTPSFFASFARGAPHRSVRSVKRS